MLIPVEDLVLLQSFLKLFAMLILVWKENNPGQDLCFESSQVYHLTIMYHFEHINHDNHVNPSFYNLYKIFLSARNLHQ